jgi:hypothetical protein
MTKTISKDAKQADKATAFVLPTNLKKGDAISGVFKGIKDRKTGSGKFLIIEGHNKNMPQFKGYDENEQPIIERIDVDCVFLSTNTALERHFGEGKVELNTNVKITYNGKVKKESPKGKYTEHEFTISLG